MRRAYAFSFFSHHVKLNKEGNNYFCIWVIGVPCCSEWFLSSKIPHNKMDIFPNNFFHIGSNCWRCMNNLVHQKLIQYCGFSSIIQTNNTDFVFWKIIIFIIQFVSSKINYEGKWNKNFFQFSSPNIYARYLYKPILVKWGH